jgi:uncharacterized protein with gpF-like domain
MANVTKYRNKWLKYHESYEKRSLKVLRKVFKGWNEKIIGHQFTDDNVKSQLFALTSSEDMYQAYLEIYFNVGSKHGVRVGKFINEGLKQFTIAEFMALFERELPLFLRQFAITRIQQVHRSYLEVIFNMFNERLLAGKTLKETTDEIFKIMRSPRFYRWEAERIARTETTAAANYAATQSGRVSGFVMQKRWISALDARTRTHLKGDFDHREMNGQRVGLNEDFVFNPKTLNEDRLSYPGDPKGRAGNVINCRCTVAVVPARDKQGNLIPTN